MTTTPTAGVRDGLSCLLGWLARHPQVQLCSIEYLSDEAAEVSLGSTDRAAGLAAAADVADALADPDVTVADRRGVVKVTVTGTVPGAAGLEIYCEITACDDARQWLLSSLGAPPDPAARSWPVTAERLRALAQAADTAASA